MAASSRIRRRVEAMTNDELRSYIPASPLIHDLVKEAVMRVLDEHKLMRESLEKIDAMTYADNSVWQVAAEVLAKVSK